MTIEINNSKTVNVAEYSLIVRDKKLFNIVTNEFEAIDGDKITFCALDIHNHKFWVSGTVDGYTCNRRIKLKNVNELFACAIGTRKTIVHNSIITDSDFEPIEEEKTVLEEDWEAVLS